MNELINSYFFCYFYFSRLKELLPRAIFRNRNLDISDVSVDRVSMESNIDEKIIFSCLLAIMEARGIAFSFHPRCGNFSRNCSFNFCLVIKCKYLRRNIARQWFKVRREQSVHPRALSDCVSLPPRPACKSALNTRSRIRDCV